MKQRIPSLNDYINEQAVLDDKFFRPLRYIMSPYGDPSEKYPDDIFPCYVIGVIPSKHLSFDVFERESKMKWLMLDTYDVLGSNETAFAGKVKDIKNLYIRLNALHKGVSEGLPHHALALSTGIYSVVKKELIEIDGTLNYALKKAIDDHGEKLK
ncbi:MAG: hypothetical protein WC979_01085 [Candidatus Pacearchaeota archaeon]|jgi:hypothetical protein|nr:hypothetical protein [Clostridia bacterium]